jgi:hypothetical protein
MIREDKHDRALDALHAVLVYARMMATKRVGYDDLVEVLDVAEYLPTLFLRTDDQTEHFRQQLFDHAHKYPAFQAALEQFDKFA